MSCKMPIGADRAGRRGCGSAGLLSAGSREPLQRDSPIGEGPVHLVCAKKAGRFQEVRTPVFFDATGERISLCRKKHRKNRGVGMTDWVHTYATDHRRDGAVRFRFHPGCPVLQPEIGQSG